MTAELQDDVARAWAELLGRWEDEAAHRALLDRFCDLEGLAEVGGLYRDVLALRPGDAVARRWRDEVVRRATAAGLASLPRSAAEVPRVAAWVRPVVVVILAVVLALGALLLFRTMATWSRP